VIGNWFAWSVGQPLREISMSNLPNTNRNVSARNDRIWFDRRSFSDHFAGLQETVRLGNWPKNSSRTQKSSQRRPSSAYHDRGIVFGQNRVNAPSSAIRFFASIFVLGRCRGPFSRIRSLFDTILELVGFGKMRFDMDKNRLE